jgi:hypothetical protein
MTRRSLIILLIAILLTPCLAGPKGKSAGWVDMFDGKTLKGWKQLNGTASYKVVNGTILGKTTEGSPNSFLCSDKQYGDFILEFEVNCQTGLNSGVQIRSRGKTDADVPADQKNAKNTHAGRIFGPQVEIEASPGQAGYVYGEATDWKWLSEAPKSKDPKVKEHSYYKNDQWNHFLIVAKGPSIVTFINGQKVADLTHEGIYKTHPKGRIGLQVHGIKAGSGPYEVSWRNIRIREL